MNGPERGSPPRRATQVSAGGVLYRRDADGVYVCLIAKHGGRVWALPKGRLDEGESAEATAVREVLEETGHEAAIEEPLGDIEYDFLWKATRTHYQKRVRYYLMTLVRPDAQPRDQEADAVEWVEISHARDRVTHDNERDIVREAERRLRGSHD